MVKEKGVRERVNLEEARGDRGGGAGSGEWGTHVSEAIMNVAADEKPSKTRIDTIQNMERSRFFLLFLPFA